MIFYLQVFNTMLLNAAPGICVMCLLAFMIAALYPCALGLTDMNFPTGGPCGFGTDRTLPWYF